MLAIKKKKPMDASSAETLLPVCRSVHKNTARLVFDHCQITNPNPADRDFHPVISNDGSLTKLITSAHLLLDKYQHHKLRLGATSSF